MLRDKIGQIKDDREKGQGEQVAISVSARPLCGTGRQSLHTLRVHRVPTDLLRRRGSQVAPLINFSGFGTALSAMYIGRATRGFLLLKTQGKPLICQANIHKDLHPNKIFPVARKWSN